MSNDKKPVDQEARDWITGKNPEGLKHNLFIRAGAGAGKTEALTERVKNLLLEKVVFPEKLAVITYTTKAAEELKDRLRYFLEKAASEDESKERRTKAVSVLDDLNKAKISTVHAFCFDLLKEYPVEFWIDPASEVADERVSASIETEVRKMFYKAEFEKDSRFLRELVARERLNEEFQNSMNDETLFYLFSVLYKNRELKPRPFALTRESCRKTVMSELTSLLWVLGEDLCVNIEDQIKKKEDKLYSDLKWRVALLKKYRIHERNKTGAGEFITVLYNEGEKNPFPHKKMGVATNYKNAKWLADLKARSDGFKQGIEELKLLRAAECYNLVLEIYPMYNDLYTGFKGEHGFLDFADCLIRVRDGLKMNRFLKESLQRRFDAVIVDEFQDSDPLQSEILFQICGIDPDPKVPWEEQKPGPGTLCFVGDPKQSIYAFARADISIFLKVMKLVIEKNKKSDVVLPSNFRSRPELVEFFNEYFSRLITENDASPAYDAMVAHREKEGGGPGVEILEVNVGLSTDNESTPGMGVRGLSKAEKETREAWAVAGFIQEEIEKGKKDPGDFLVLFRKKSGMESYEEALRLKGIAAVNTATESFLKDHDVIPLINLAALLVHPREKMYLYAVLRSAYLGYTDSDIDSMLKDIPSRELSLERVSEKEPSLRRLFKISISQQSLPVKFEEACESLSLISGGAAFKNDNLESAIINLSEILKAELEVTDFNEKETVSNLLNGTLLADSHQKDIEGMSEEKLVLDSPESKKVRLMTIHSAKGLQGKIVILANPLAKKISGAEILVDREKGELISVKKSIGGVLLTKLEEISSEVAREEFFRDEEEKRVLYVGVTRPKEKLYIVTYEGSKVENFLEPLHELIKGEVPRTKLALTEDYRTRYRGTGKSKPLTFSGVSEGDLETEKAKILLKVCDRRETSEAVTTMLEAEARKIFGKRTGAGGRGVDYGSLLHEVLHWICLRAGARVKTSVSDVEMAVERFNEPYGFGADDLGRLIVALKTFLEGDLYGKILNAEALMPEVPFKKEGVVHGIIDLLYLDRQGLHIVDWKSDVFDTKDHEAEVKAHYSKQLSFYADAVKAILGEEVKSQRCVFLFQVPDSYETGKQNANSARLS